jgi:hypothetical protein
MKRIFIIALALVAIVACNKDKFQTKPQVTIKSYNLTQVPFNAPLIFTLEVTDKEGDVDDSMFVIRQRLNKKNTTLPSTSRFDIPTFPDKASAEFTLSYRYAFELTGGLLPIDIPGTGTPAKKEVDTLIFKFVVKDKAGNRSDTTTSQPIYVERR